MKQDSLKPYVLIDHHDSMMHDGHKTNKQCYKTLASVAYQTKWRYCLFLVKNASMAKYWYRPGISKFSTTNVSDQLVKSSIGASLQVTQVQQLEYIPYELQM